MNTTTVSSKGQVVLPKSVRDALGIQAGSRLGVRVDGSRVILETRHMPWRPLNPAGLRLSSKALCRPVELARSNDIDRG